jgi:predicted nucleic acid-binding protein
LAANERKWSQTTAKGRRRSPPSDSDRAPVADYRVSLFGLTLAELAEDAEKAGYWSSATPSNTSPLLYLHQTGHLDLLKRLYGRIGLAPAVLSELRAGAALGISVPEPADHDWLATLSVFNPHLMPLVTDLGPGETETIAQALEHPGSLVILDDLPGRRAARAAGLCVTGTLGVLLKAKRAGLQSFRTLPPLGGKLTVPVSARLGLHEAAASGTDPSRRLAFVMEPM